jgi:hypothetical protein
MILQFGEYQIDDNSSMLLTLLTKTPWALRDVESQFGLWMLSTVGLNFVPVGTGYLEQGM